MLHVINCTNTNDVKREWIHIRWSKEYLLNYLNRTTDTEINLIYEKLYDCHPKGLKYIHQTATSSYPIYKGFDNRSIQSSMFDVPNSQFMCQKTLSLWVESNNTNDPELQQLLSKNDHEMITQNVILSQQQHNHISQSQNDDYVLDDNNSQSSLSHIYSNICGDDEVTDWNDNIGLLKRAFQLAGCDVNKHRQLYNSINNFIIENEINHNDNDEVLQNRSKDDTVIISSNRIVNKRHKSMKRKKQGMRNKFFSYFIYFLG